MRAWEGMVATIQQAVRGQVLDLFEKEGLLDDEASANMRGWSHAGGFPLDASIRIEAWDRGGLDRLPPYCARPPFASETPRPENREEESAARTRGCGQHRWRASTRSFPLHQAEHSFPTHSPILPSPPLPDVLQRDRP